MHLGLKFRSFVDARQFVYSLGLKSQSEWVRYSKSYIHQAIYHQTPIERTRMNGKDLVIGLI
jgi:hypothetical protein